MPYLCDLALANKYSHTFRMHTPEKVQRYVWNLRRRYVLDTMKGLIMLYVLEQHMN